MRKIGLLLLLVISIQVQAQDDAKKDSLDGWKRAGTFTFLFNQSAFSNYVAGGVNNIAGNLGINYNFNYKKGNLSWDNNITTAYGLTKIQGEDLQKTDDRFEYNSLFGKKIKDTYWDFSFFLNFRTQFDKGFVDGTDPVSGEAIRVENSRILSPAYLAFGPGLQWKKNDNLKFNLAPGSSRLTFVNELFTRDAAAFGVDQGETIRYEVGFYANGYYKFTIVENVTMENILVLYTNYLENPQNIDINYQINFVAQINKYLSTNLSLQALYDDDAIGRVQLREVFGLGVNFLF